MSPLVTIIIATYNRPDVLRIAIRSVLNQTISDWKLLVIGDNCKDSTGLLIKKIEDKRIRYINLQERFGEQSGPNSVGLRLADTPYIAYLNHDDVWLPDHLEKGLSALSSAQYQFYIGGAAFSSFFNQSREKSEIYIDEINADKNRSSYSFYKRKVRDYEPASSWITTAQVAKSVGHWNSYRNIYRPPIEDYLLRIWKCGFKFYFSKEVTVWHVLTHYKKNKNKFYNHKGDEYKLVEHIITTKSADKIRDQFDKGLSDWKKLDTNDKKQITDNFDWHKNQSTISRLLRQIIKFMAMNNFTAFTYRYLRIDFYVIICKLTRQNKGFMMSRVLQLRAEKIRTNPDLEEIVKGIRSVEL